jgi:hypothetical protein
MNINTRCEPQAIQLSMPLNIPYYIPAEYLIGV